MSSDEDDERYARDLQIALDMQAEEEERAERERSSSGHHSHTEQGFADRKSLQQPDHMLFIICELEGKAVETLVDSGACCSVISRKLVHQLGLTKHFNQNLTGKASGVGAANIVGILENLVCVMGHVEFRLFFLVLDSNDPWMILGLDQMRRFKCVIDLEKNVLVFGGREGVEVPFLDSEMAAEAAAKKIMADAGMEVAPPRSKSNDKNGKKLGFRNFFKK